MKVKKQLFNALAKKALWCAGLFFAVLCVVAPGRAHALVPAKAPDMSQKDATYVGMETCVTCHEKQGKEFKLSPHARLVATGTKDEAQACETCHGPGSKHAENGGGIGNAITNPKKDPTICFTCHMEKKMEFRLPNHHPVLEGKMGCVDCHDLHGADAKASFTSLQGPNEVCFKCHKDQQGPFVFEHAAMREGCASCHKVHGSINAKMLVARDFNLCLKCHTQADFPVLGPDDDHATNIARGGACWACHTRPHGSNFSKAFTY